jgi:hypothetical protein
MLISGTIIPIIGVMGFASENVFADKNDVKKNAEGNNHANKNAEGNFFFSHAYSIRH